MNTAKINTVKDRLAIVIKGPSGRILMQGFVYTAADIDRCTPMFQHWLGVRRGLTLADEAKTELAKT